MQRPKRAEAEPLLLRLPEVCARLGLGRSTVYSMIQRGELPAVRIGRAVRIPAAAIDAWVADRIRQADTELV